MLITVEELQRNFKVDPAVIERCIQKKLLRVVSQKSGKRLLERRVSGQVLRKILWLQKEGFSLRVIFRVIGE